MRFLTHHFRSGLGMAAMFAASLFLSGCSHLTYNDPNPSTPYAFPGQGVNQAAVTLPPPSNPSIYAPSGVSQQPTPLVPVGLPVGPVVPPPNTFSAERGAVSLLTIGENVTVTFSDLPPQGGIPDQKLRIGEDGKITLPLNVTVQAAGKTANQLAEDIRKEYVPKYFVRVTTAVKTEERFYYVGGEVKIPNRQIYFGDTTVLRAIDTAGGFTDFADRGNIEVRRSTGQRETINWKKAIKDPRLDLPVFPNDQITVHKRRPIF